MSAAAMCYEDGGFSLPACGGGSGWGVRLASVAQAVAAIPDGATVAVDGFTLMGVAEALYEGIEESFRKSGHPRSLVIVHAAGQSNRQIGFEHFAVEGLAKRIVGSHWGLMPKMSSFLGQGLAEAVCLPQGQISGLYRAIAAGRPGNLTRIRIGTCRAARSRPGRSPSPAASSTWSSRRPSRSASIDSQTVSSLTRDIFRRRLAPSCHARRTRRGWRSAGAQLDSYIAATS